MFGCGCRGCRSGWTRPTCSAAFWPGRRPPSGIDLRAAWKIDRPGWHCEVSSWVFGFAAREAAAAHRNFLAGRAKFPRFAKRGRTRERFTIIGRDAPLSAGALRLPKIGVVRVASPDPAQAKLRRLVRRGRARVTSVTVARHADGTWWAAFKVERQLRTPAAAHAHAGAPTVGVDRGVKTAAFVATADGDLVAELAAGRHLRAAATRLAHAQRTVARRTRRGQPSSKSRFKAVARVGRLHEKVAAQRAAAGGSQVRDPHPSGRSDEPARHACGGWVSGPAAQAAGPVLPGEAGTSRPLVA